MLLAFGGGKLAGSINILKSGDPLRRARKRSGVELLRKRLNRETFIFNLHNNYCNCLPRYDHRKTESLRSSEESGAIRMGRTESGQMVNDSGSDERHVAGHKNHCLRFCSLES